MVKFTNGRRQILTSIVATFVILAAASVQAGSILDSILSGQRPRESSTEPEAEAVTAQDEKAAPDTEAERTQWTGTVNVNTSLNVRTGPSTSYQKVGSLYPGQKVPILGKHHGWYRIKYKGRIRWICGRYIRGNDKNVAPPAKVKRTTGSVKPAGLNVRTGPGRKNSRINVLPKGSKVIITGERKGWYRIKLGKHSGWVYAKYIDIHGKKTRYGGGGSDTDSPPKPPKDESGKTEIPPPGKGKGGAWLAKFLYSKGLRGEKLKTMWAIGMRESGGNPGVYHDHKTSPEMYSPGNGDYGLFQINKVHEKWVKDTFGYSMKDLLDPDKNFRVMWRMSQKGEKLSAWGLGPKGRQTYSMWDDDKFYRWVTEPFERYSKQFDSYAEKAGLPKYADDPGKNKGKPQKDKPDDPQKPKISGNKVYIDVPKRTQFDPANGKYQNSWCGPTSLAMVYDYYGINKTTVKVAKTVYNKNVGGTYYMDIVKDARKNGFPNTTVKFNKGFSYLKKNLEQGRPVIVGVEVAWKSGHYMVVVGMKGDKIIVNDPGRSAVRRTLSKSWFLTQWNGRSQRSIVLKK